MDIVKMVEDFRIGCAKSDARRDAGLSTPENIVRFDDISYGPYGDANLLDVYVQQGVKTPQATIVNVHGGGWVYGSKEVYQFYCMSLANRGFTVVNINYRLAPEHLFPAAVQDINAALTFLAKNGSKYFVDKERLVLVGDSAGGQLVSHYAAIYSNPDFAKNVDFVLPEVCIRAVGLNCGAYFERDMISSGKDTFFNIYSGCDSSREVAENEKTAKLLDTAANITAAYPPSFVMSAQNDFLLHKAAPMYELIKGFGVPARLKIYGTKEQKEVAHVFHVNCCLKEAVECNDDECEFFREFTK